MNPIGYMGDGYFLRRPAWEEFLKQTATDLTMQGTDPIDHLATTNGQPGHVKGFFGIFGMGTSQTQDLFRIYPKKALASFQITTYQGGSEAVKSRCYRGMGGKDVPGAGGVEGAVKITAGILHMTVDSCQDHQGRMTLVQVADFRGDSQTAQ